MLKEFRITNFKSINKRQVFTMEACPKSVVSEYFEQHVIQKHKEKLLKVSSFYGPNGGGKSNLIKAFSLFRNLISNNESYVGYQSDEPFISSLFNKSKETTFDLFIVNDDYEIGYSISFDASKTKEIEKDVYVRRKIIDVEILTEEFIYRPLQEKEFRTLFVRKKGAVTSSNSFIKEMDILNNNKNLANNLSFIGYVANTFDMLQNIEDIKPIFDMHKEVSNAVLLSKDSAYPQSLYYGEGFVKRIKPFIPRVVSMLNQIDFRIKDLVFLKNRERLNVLYVKRVCSDGSETSLPISNESSGTKKLIQILFDITSTNDTTIYMADDFDSYLHPKLVKCIIDLFTSVDNNNKQLIMNSHDIVNMNNKTFRRDEIWFAYRDENFSTIYQPLSNIVDYKGDMIRKDAIYSKQYLEGKYGADPFVQCALSWKK